MIHWAWLIVAFFAGVAATWLYLLFRFIHSWK